jgi:hypothetical protein
MMTDVLFVFMPVVVTTSPLYRVGLDMTGQVDVSPVDRMLLMNRQPPEAKIMSTWVLHEDAVQKFVDDAGKSIQELSLRGF